MISKKMILTFRTIDLCWMMMMMMMMMMNFFNGMVDLGTADSPISRKDHRQEATLSCLPKTPIYPGSLKLQFTTSRRHNRLNYQLIGISTSTYAQLAHDLQG